MKPLDFFVPVPGLGVKRPPSFGNVYYVDTYGANVNDSHEGTDPDQPLQKIATAIGKCSDDGNDYVFVLDCYDADTEPITIDKSLCHVIGMATPTPFVWPMISASAVDCFEISDSYVELAGFHLASSGSSAGVDVQNAGGFWIHHMNFATAVVSLQYGIQLSTGDGNDGLVEDCVFGKLQTCITTNGIDGAFTGCTIRNNFFLSCAGIGINLTGANCGYIYSNYFFEDQSTSPSTGWAITLGSHCTNGIIMRNFASVTGAIGAAGDQPYKDNSAATEGTLKNGWTGNYYGETIVDAEDSTG